MVEDRLTALEARMGALEHWAMNPWGTAPAPGDASAAPPHTAQAAHGASGPAARAVASPPSGVATSPPLGTAASPPFGAVTSPPPGTAASPPSGAATSPPSGAATSPPLGVATGSRFATAAPATSRRFVPAPPRPKRDLEDFLGGSVLAWLGGVAVLAGLAFLLTIAVSRGWIGEGARTALAAALSLGLLGSGVWLREHRGRYEAALAAAAVGIAGSFGTLVVAGPVYGLIPDDVALLGAFAAGAVATTLSLRWDAPVMGWLGLLGALWAPAVLGTEALAFLAVAYAATVAVLVRQRWTTLAGFAFVTVALQVVAYGGASILALAGFGALTAVLALGLEANRRGLHTAAIGPEARPRPLWLAAALLTLGAVVLALAGWDFLDGERWLAALAVAHIALGLVATRVPRISREIALIAVAIGVVLANVAFAAVASGLPLVLGWSLSAIPFAGLLGARRPGHESRVADLILGRPQAADRILAMAGLAGQLSLAALNGLLFDARPTELAGPFASDAALAAAGAIAVVAWTCGRLAGPRWRAGLDVLALAALAHFTGLALEGVALTVTLAAQALGLASLARHNGDRLTGWAAVAFAAVALGHALVTIAPPQALLDGLADPLAAAGALLAVAAATLAAARGIQHARPVVHEQAAGRGEAQAILQAAAALVLLYLASVEVVTLAGGGQDGQTALSVLWAVAGVAALVRGLVADDRGLRRGALALLALTATKVFLYDLASLTSLYRVGSLIGLGLLLLCGAYAWQHVRPRAVQTR